MEVPKIRVSILVAFSLVNHPFWGTSILGNPQICKHMEKEYGKSMRKNEADKRNKSTDYLIIDASIVGSKNAQAKLNNILAE